MKIKKLSDYHVIEVKPLAGHRVSLRFREGTEKEMDLAPFLVGPVFDAIRADADSFAAMKIEDGALTWENGADIDPLVLYCGGRKEAEDALANQVGKPTAATAK